MSGSQARVLGAIGIEPDTACGVPSVTTHIGQQFELQVIELFKKVLALNTVENLTKHTIENRVVFFDFSFSYQGKQYAVEVRYYRTQTAQMHLIMRAAEMLQKCAMHLNYQPILVIGAVLHQQQRNLLKEKFSTLILVDRENLLNTAYHHDLTNHLTPFFGMTEWDNYTDAKDLLALLRDVNHD